MQNYKLEEMLPHDNPMILIDKIKEVNFEEKFITATVTIKENDIFFNKEINGISPIVAIEYMAQTIGCHAFYKNGCKKIDIGLLLGTRLLECDLDVFVLGQTYEIKAAEVFFDGELVSYECFIYNNQKECAKATLNAFMPQKAQDFINGVQL